MLVPTFIAAKVDLPLGKDLGDIHQKTGTVVCVNADLHGIEPPLSSACHSASMRRAAQFRQIQDIDTVGAVNGHAASSCDKAHDLIARDRIAAFGEANCHIVDTAHDDAALALSTGRTFSPDAASSTCSSVISFYLCFSYVSIQLVEDLALF